MKNYTFYLMLFTFFFSNILTSQESFETNVKAIAQKIKTITQTEKDSLKIEVEAVNNDCKNGLLTEFEAEEKKIKLAEKRAKSIESKIANLQLELNNLVQQKVDESVDNTDTNERYSFHFPGMKVKDKLKEKERATSKTTSQFVFAFGLNNLMTDNSLDHSDFRYWGSHFYEFGVTYNKPLFKNDNLLHLKYGVSLMYNNLRPENNQYFVDNGSQTNLATYVLDLKESRFKNFNLVVPIHLEFDFSGNNRKSENHRFKTHESLRIGMGGYLGTNLKSKQILKYRDIADNKVVEKTKGNYNVNNFIYGLSAYVGYEETSLYIKYDLNPVFKNNSVDQNNISLGIRFDLN